MDPGQGLSLSRKALKDSSSQAPGKGLQIPQAAGGLRQAVRCEASPTPPCEMLSAVWGSGRPAHMHRIIGSSTGGPGGSSVHRRGLSQSPGLIATQVHAGITWEVLPAAHRSRLSRGGTRCF